MRLKVVIVAALCAIGIFLFSTQVNGDTIPVAGIVQELGELQLTTAQEVEIKAGDKELKENIDAQREELQEEVRLARLESAIERCEIQVEPEIEYDEYYIPNYSGMKSWMSWKNITSTSSPQYKLQAWYAWTDGQGFRLADDRYCIAVGSHFGAKIGDYIDLVLENGTVIECIMGDQKADHDTDESNIFTQNGCATEFLINPDSLNSTVRSRGDCSYRQEDWNSKVVKVKVYDKNIFNGEEVI